MIFRLTRRWQIMVVTCLLLTLQWGEKITIIARESCSTILDCRMLIKKELKMFQTSSINAHGKLEPWRRSSRNWDILRWKNTTEYRISSNNSRPSINRLRQITAPPPPLSQSSSFYPLPVKLKCNEIQQNWSVTIQALKINQGTKLGTLKKPMFSLFDFQWVIFEIIIASCLCEKRNNHPRLLFEEMR